MEHTSTSGTVREDSGTVARSSPGAAWALSDLHSTRRELRVLARILHLPLHSPRGEHRAPSSSAAVAPFESPHAAAAAVSTPGRLLRSSPAPAATPLHSHHPAQLAANDAHIPYDYTATTATPTPATPAPFGHSAAAAAATAAASPIVPPVISIPPAPYGGDLSAQLKGQELDRLVEQLARWNEQVSLEAQTAAARAQSVQRVLGMAAPPSEPGSPAAEPMGRFSHRSNPSEDSNGDWGTDTDSGYFEAARAAPPRPTLAAPPASLEPAYFDAAAVPALEHSKSESDAYSSRTASTTGGTSPDSHLYAQTGEITIPPPAVVQRSESAITVAHFRNVPRGSGGGGGSGGDGGDAFRGSGSAQPSRRHTAQEGLGLRVSWTDEGAPRVHTAPLPYAASVPVSALSSPYLGARPSPAAAAAAASAAAAAPAAASPSPSELWQRHHRDIAHRDAPEHEDAEFAETCAQIDEQMRQDSLHETSAAFDPSSSAWTGGVRGEPFASPWTPAAAAPSSSPSNPASHPHVQAQSRREGHAPTHTRSLTQAEQADRSFVSPVWALSPIGSPQQQEQQRLQHQHESQHSTPLHPATSTYSPPQRQEQQQQQQQQQSHRRSLSHQRHSSTHMQPQPLLHQLQHQQHQQQQHHPAQHSIGTRAAPRPVSASANASAPHPQAHAQQARSLAQLQAQVQGQARAEAQAEVQARRHNASGNGGVFGGFAAAAAEETVVAHASTDFERTLPARHISAAQQQRHFSQQRSSSRPPPPPPPPASSTRGGVHAQSQAQARHKRAQSGLVQGAQARRFAVPSAVPRAVRAVRAPGSNNNSSSNISNSNNSNNSNNSAPGASPPSAIASPAVSSTATASTSTGPGSPCALPVEVASRLVASRAPRAHVGSKGANAGARASSLSRGSRGPNRSLSSSPSVSFLASSSASPAATAAMVRVETCLRVGGVDVGAASAEAGSYEEAESAALLAVLARAGPAHARALLGPAVALAPTPAPESGHGHGHGGAPASQQQQQSYEWEPSPDEDASQLDGRRKWGRRGPPLSAAYFAPSPCASASPSADGERHHDTPLSPTRQREFVSVAAARSGLLYSPDAPPSWPGSASPSPAGQLHLHELSGLIPPAVVRSQSGLVDAQSMATTQRFAEDHQTQYVPALDFFAQCAAAAAARADRQGEEEGGGEGDHSAACGAPPLAVRQRLQQHLFRKALWADAEAEEAAQQDLSRASAAGESQRRAHSPSPSPSSSPVPSPSPSASPAAMGSPDPQRLYAQESALGVSPRRQLLHHFLALRARKFPDLPGQVGALRRFARSAGLASMDASQTAGTHASAAAASVDDLAVLQGRPARAFSSPKDAAAFLARTRSLRLSPGPLTPDAGANLGAAVLQGEWRRYRWQWKPRARIVPQQRESHQRPQQQQDRAHQRSQSASHSFSSPAVPSSASDGWSSPLSRLGPALRPALPATDLPVEEWARTNLFDLVQAHPHPQPLTQTQTHAHTRVQARVAPAQTTEFDAGTDLHSERQRFAEPQPWPRSARTGELEAEQEEEAWPEEEEEQWRREEEEEEKYAAAYAPQWGAQQNQFQHDGDEAQEDTSDTRDWARATLRRLDARQQEQQQQQFGHAQSDWRSPGPNGSLHLDHLASPVPVVVAHDGGGYGHH